MCSRCPLLPNAGVINRAKLLKQFGIKRFQGVFVMGGSKNNKDGFTNSI